MTHEQILAVRLRLIEFSFRHSLRELLRETLDEAETLTGSCIGFYHFLDRDQQMLTLQAWSTRTSAEFCKAEGAGSHYPVSHAGVWVDCIAQRCPVIHNDYASLPHRKGMPEGHAEVIRELVVPVLRNGRIVAILGVGNKQTDYTLHDVGTVNLLADLAWDIAEQKRAEEALHETNIRLEQEIADRQRAEEELTVKNLQLAQFNETLAHRIKETVSQIQAKDQLMFQQQRQAVMGELIQNITHQLKQPLNGLGLLLQTMAFDIRQESADTALMLKDIDRSLDLISFLSQTITDFSSFFRMGHQKSAFDVYAAADRTIQLIAAHLESRNVQVSFDPVSEQCVEGYQNELSQVLLNLVGNAVDVFAERAIPDPAIRIGITRQDDEVVITVADNGGGISPLLIDQIFEPHFTTKPEDKGSGIGLTMSKTIIEQHFGGQIRVENRNGGALFLIAIPAARDQQTEER